MEGQDTGFDKHQNLPYVIVSGWPWHDCQLFIGLLVCFHTLLKIQIISSIETNVKWLGQTLSGGTEILEIPGCN
jgi:hypothetical protein